MDPFRPDAERNRRAGDPAHPEEVRQLNANMEAAAAARNGMR
jgi:hypothetical protein